ncbi:MAG: excinuclease ABC subunit UvrA [Firmicutes bacterium]|nr:excinuclease ABC subunit UvrA [Bacillota bacterium]
MAEKNIVIKGANENNLKNIDLEIPRDEMVVITGLSGSGKSTLAFDTIYAEGQRRYMESVSAYARQFLGQMEKPDVEYIEGLSPSISIDQKTTSKNPRSIVGTVTEIYDYLRLMYARIGVPHCPVCGIEISSQSVDQIVDLIMEYPERTKIMVMAPVVKQQKGEHKKILERIKKEGFLRVRVDGEMYNLSEDEINLEKTYKHTIELIVDRIVVKPDSFSRLTEAVELAITEGYGLVLVNFTTPDGETGERVFSTKFACPEHGVSISEMEPRSFSFNSPFGACQSCNGLGFIQTVDPELIIQDKTKSLNDGALGAGFNQLDDMSYYAKMIHALAQVHGVDLDTPYEDLPEVFRHELMYGTGGRQIEFTYESRNGGIKTQRKQRYEGIVNNFERRYSETRSEYIREKIEAFMSFRPCPDCHGERLRPEVLAVTVNGVNIMEFCHMAVRDSLTFINNLQLTEKQAMIARQILKEIRARLKFLADVGLDYLTLSRSAGTLSGGESQRIRLATQIGSGLVGVLYILDEPSIGLHQRDNDKLLGTLRHLTDIGNTLLIVEHDEDTMYAADHIIDIGPGAGIHGGEIVAQGTVEEIKACAESLTGQYLSGVKKIDVPAERRTGNGNYIKVKGAAQNNLQNIDVDFPLGVFNCVTGVSGSGKSSLVNEVLAKALAAKINRSKEKAGAHDSIEGVEHIDKIIVIDQSPIGRTPRSNPATYTGVFTHIRDLFAQTQDAKLRGYGKGRFSFNVKGGRCEACSGDGIIKIEMNFLPDVYVPCEVCKGKRYNRETLEVKYKGKSIFDVLNMNVEEALKFFENIPSIARQLQTLYDVGLGYIKLGQPSTQLSGGEAQRIKLASELSKRMTGRTMYILDEPTTGLHFADVDRLLQMLSRLVDAGNTLVVIEHNLDVIKCADHVIDLGPEGGDKGGNIVVTGTPEEVAACPQSYTGKYLGRLLNKK